MYTRKNYRIVARALYEAVQETNGDTQLTGIQALNVFARILCRILREDNGRFDSLRFLKASGLFIN